MISIERPRHIRGTTGFMRSRLPQLLVVCRGGAVFLQPGYKRGTARIAAGRLIPGVCPSRTRDHAVHAVIHHSLEVARKMQRNSKCVVDRALHVVGDVVTEPSHLACDFQRLVNDRMNRMIPEYA